jgi:hypothetical protein
MVFAWGIGGFVLGALIRELAGLGGFWGFWVHWCTLGLGLNRWAMDPRPVDGTTPWRVWFWALFWSWAWPVPLCLTCCLKAVEALVPRPELELEDDWRREQPRS